MARTNLIMAAAVVLSAAAATAQVPLPAAGTYTWHGELVAVEGNNITVKTRAIGDAATQAKALKAGERVNLTWSGFDVAAHAVRGVARYDAGAVAKSDLVLPAELVSPAVQNDMLTVKIRVGDVPASVKALKPGDWVTITSRHKPASDAQANVSVAPYVTMPNGPNS